MRLEIRDIESSMVYDIGPDGAVLGRERAKTDISLRDESISKRHARIFMESGGWFLEDLNSSNGTYLDEQRITAPVELTQGMLFSLAQRKFEVVFMDGAGAPAGNGAMDDFPPPAGMNDGGYAAASSQSDFDDDFGVPSGSGDDEVPEGEGFGYFMVAVPKAIAYYMANVPLMAINPPGTIKKGAEEQRLEAKSKMEIAAYAIPAGVVGPLIGGIAAFIALAINGTIAFGGLIGALPAAAIGGVVGAIFGYFAHPILNWIINFLKGESTARSRTNYIIGAYTLGLLTAVPNAIATIVTALPVPFIRLLGPLLSLVVSLVGLYFAFTWVKAFKLVKWVKYVVIVLGVLSVLGTAYGFVTGAYNEIMAFVDGTPSGSSGDVADIDIDDVELTEEQKQAIAAMPEEVRAKAEEQYKQANAVAAKMAAKAAAATDEATKDVEEATEDAKDAVEEATDEATENAKDAVADAKDAVEETSERTAPPPPPPPPPTRTAPPPPPRAPPPVAPGSINTDEHPLGITPFVAYLMKRDAVERAVSDRPSLLEDKRILREYRSLWRTTYDVRKKYSKLGRRADRFEKDKILSRQKGQEIMEKTTKNVDRLYGMIFN